MPPGEVVAEGGSCCFAGGKVDSAGPFGVGQNANEDDEEALRMHSPEKLCSCWWDCWGRRRRWWWR